MNKKDKKSFDEFAKLLSVQTAQNDRIQYATDKNKNVLNSLEDSFMAIMAEQDELIAMLENQEECPDESSLLNYVDSLSEDIDNIQNYQAEKIETFEVADSWDEYVEDNRTFAKTHNISLDNPYISMFATNELTYFSREMIEKFEICELTSFDYAFAAASGIITGIIDICLVGTISRDHSQSVLQEKVDNSFDKIITKYAQFEKKAKIKVNEKAALGNHPERESEIKEKFKNLSADVDHMNEKQAKSFLEENHKVAYDRATKIILEDGTVVLDGMTPDNHHLMSVSHNPSIHGLLFGIIDQITEKGTFFDPKTGKILRIATNNYNKELGNSLPRKIVNAVCNWFGHVMSDIGGSKSSKGRGSGLPVPGWDALQKLHFGRIPINGKNMNIAQLSDWMFKNGMDIRSFTAQAIPVLVNECLVRLYWFFKQKFYFGKSFKESLPMANNREVARMLLTATSVFSSVDVIHATVKSAGFTDLATFVMTVNLPGLADLGLRSVQNLRFEIQHRKHVENIIDNDIKQEWDRILSE